MYSSIRQSPETFEKRSLLQELDFLRNKVQELETENKLLVEEQAVVHKRAHDVITADSTIESYIKESNNLAIELDRMTKLAKQRKTDADLWRSKYENQMSQILQIKQNYEYELRQNSAEIQKLNSLLQQSEFERQKSVLGIQGQIESQANSDIENLKKATNLQIEISESQIRKLRDHIEEQNNQVSELQSKLLRQKAEDDNTKERLLKDNELLRLKSNQQDQEKQRELEQLNDSLNSFTEQQISILKAEFARQADVLQTEIEKLRGLLEIKNAEIETLMQQNQKNKLLYETSIAELQEDLQIMRERLLDTERAARLNLELQQKDLLTQFHRDTDILKANLEGQIHNLEKDNINLKGVIDHKNQQIQIQMDEKNAVRVQLEGQVMDLRRELEQQKIAMFEMEKQKNHEIVELDDQFQKAQSLSNDTMESQKNQILFLEGEIEKLKDAIIQRTKELESHIAQFSLQARKYEEDLRRQRDENHQVKQELLSVINSKNNEIQDLNQKNERNTNAFREKLRQQDIVIEQNTLEIKRLREGLHVRDQELENSINQRLMLDKDYKRSIEHTEILKSKIIGIEKEKCAQLEELKNKLEASNQYQINNLKTAFNTQISVLNEENQQLKQQLDGRRIRV